MVELLNHMAQGQLKDEGYVDLKGLTELIDQEDVGAAVDISGFSLLTFEGPWGRGTVIDTEQEPMSQFSSNVQ